MGRAPGKKCGCPFEILYKSSHCQYKHTINLYKPSKVENKVGVNWHGFNVGGSSVFLHSLNPVYAMTTP